MRARLILADDHRVLTEGLSKLLAQHYDIVATAENGQQLLALAREHKPDVIVTDISMPLLNGIDALHALKRAGLRSKLLVLTMHADAALAVEAFRAGASGYLLKHAAGEEIKSAVEALLRGRNYLSASFPVDLISLLAEAARHPGTSGPKLTRRQREVLQLVAEGKTMKEVASVLSISTRTAESYKYEIMRALGIHTSAELIQYAIKIGLIRVSPFGCVA